MHRGLNDPLPAPGGQSHVPLASEQPAGEETDVSLITGALRKHGLSSDEATLPSDDPSSLVLRNQNLTVAQANTAGTGRSAWLDEVL